MKQELRARSLADRDAIDPVRRLELADTIVGHLYDLDRFRDAGAVGLYWAAGSEVSTSGIIARLSEQEERRIFLPFVLNGELELTEWRPQDPVVTAEYGGMHPRYQRKVKLDEVDVLVVPGLAFDRKGHRLGSGTGHYDRLLARLDQRTIRIGLGYQSQVVDEVPHDAGDEDVHFVATEDGLIACAPVPSGSDQR